MITLLKTALNWITGNLTRLLVIALIVVSIALFWFWKVNKSLKIDNAMVSENFVQKDRQVSQLNLTVEEFKDLDTKSSKTIDSLLKVIKERPKNIKQATSIEIQYIDTGSTKIIYKEPIVQPDKSFVIPVSFDSDCWGMKGQILSKDPGSKLEIKERIASNKAQVVVIKRKRFLFWTIRKEQIKAFNECGEISVTQINFQK